ncbi:MAG: NAD(P)/FAD-dependent oxidoreductase [Myxococcales bacterium]|nr:NAD(P)/FAD-dependent oxidoreductase [Myxococcales bacterium]
METEIAIVGGGVVGLACAAEASRRGFEVVVLERESRTGQGTTSRNSGVIHAGLYYPAGSMKSRFCIEGRESLYERCTRMGIPFRKTGKWVVAPTTDEIPTLESIASLARAAGVPGITIVEGSEFRRREPTLRGAAALWSPESGIVDAHELTDSYRRELVSHGGAVALQTEVAGLDRTPHGWNVSFRGTRGEDDRLAARMVINAAGLEADRIAESSGLEIDALGFRHRYVKGNYFAVRGFPSMPTCPLIYPVPEKDGLGIHLTQNLGGQWIAGPDTEPVESIDFRVDPHRAAAFAKSIATYLPGITEDLLTPDYAGIRPKRRVRDGYPDFVVHEGSAEGMPGIVHLLGIESPGLTASSALAKHAVDLLTE